MVGSGSGIRDKTSRIRNTDLDYTDTYHLILIISLLRREGTFAEPGALEDSERLFLPEKIHTAVLRACSVLHYCENIVLKSFFFYLNQRCTGTCPVLKETCKTVKARF
jgi:hypothetical protein